MDRACVEGEAAWLLRGLGPVPGARALVAHHLGEGAILYVRMHAPGDAYILQDTIFVRPRLGPQAFRWAVLHELAEWHLGRIRYRGEDVERVADALAAALVAPRPAYLSALKSHGPAWARLAYAFTTAETCVALRHGEVTDEPLAVVAPLTVRTRGDEAFVWPPERELRRVAVVGGAGFARERLTDDRRRVVLMAA